METARVRLELAVKTGPAPKQGPVPGGAAVIIMDDGWETQYTQGYQKLQAYGFRGCVAVIPALVGQYQYMNYRQLADLYLDGWDLLNHTYSHTDLLTLSPEEQRQQLNKARNWLKRRGFQRGADIVVYPQGSSGPGLTDLLAGEDYVAARSLDELWGVTKNAPLASVDIFNLISDSTFDEAKGAIDFAIAKKRVVILVVHKIEPVTVDTQMQLAEELFNQIVEYMALKSDSLCTLTLTELMAIGEYFMAEKDAGFRRFISNQAN